MEDTQEWEEEMPSKDWKLQTGAEGMPSEVNEIMMISQDPVGWKKSCRKMRTL